MVLIRAWQKSGKVARKRVGQSGDQRMVFPLIGEVEIFFELISGRVEDVPGCFKQVMVY